jgi:predicted MFS family arabinose efflux permease
VLAIVALSTAYYFVYGPFEAATPAFVRERLHGTEAAYSLLWTVFGIGSLASLCLAPLLARRRPGMVNALGTLAWGLAMLPLAWTSELWVAAVLFLVGGVLWGPYTAVEATALHRWVHPAHHGRVFGVQRSLLATATPLGAAVGALALDRFSPAAVLGTSAAACACAGLVALTHRGLREAD